MRRALEERGCRRAAERMPNEAIQVLEHWQIVRALRAPGVELTESLPRSHVPRAAVHLYGSLFR